MPLMLELNADMLLHCTAPRVFIVYELGDAYATFRYPEIFQD